MIPKYDVKSIIYAELKKHLADHPRELEACCEPEHLDFVIEYAYIAVNRFNDSYPIFASTWNRKKDNLVNTLSMPRYMVYDFVAKLAYSYVNKRMQQTGRSLRINPQKQTNNISLYSGNSIPTTNP